MCNQNAVQSVDTSCGQRLSMSHRPAYGWGKGFHSAPLAKEEAVTRTLGDERPQEKRATSLQNHQSRRA